MNSQNLKPLPRVNQRSLVTKLFTDGAGVDKIIEIAYSDHGLTLTREGIESILRLRINRGFD